MQTRNGSVTNVMHKIINSEFMPIIIHGIVILIVILIIPLTLTLTLTDYKRQKLWQSY